ncbi:MAG: GNAT family N-acetyltransferase [Armatimonadota bacterium]|nr:GNAT family N-acetyltransferase [Armatimonadota bacterium]MDR7484956.1 GNAT family N-acetyltransferase [Armatimonadota bacterium]MDR7533659.1 GNAT family N-acetyltransferase [Armatimonadota bacterium]MDR7535470.1 GNAT family N-acetyltransferase [Armatimonadota bacterium]
MADVTIAPLKEPAALRQVEDLQMQIWGMPEREVVPVHQLVAAVGAGGVVLGAFEADGTLVGFCYGFPAWREGRPLFYSHMAGVVGGRQLQDIGFRLKLAQRQAALDAGFDHMVWTYDPLQSVNARFNLHKLGVTAQRYFVNYYGEMPDQLNRGLESDRFEVDWALRSPRVEAAAAGRPVERDWGDAPRALEAVPHPAGVAPRAPALDLAAPVLFVEIPTDFTAVRSRDRGLAQAWRLATRQVFPHYFARGYRAVDFLLRPDDRLRGDYVLVGGAHAD